MNRPTANQVFVCLFLLTLLSIIACQPSDQKKYPSTYFNHVFLNVADIDKSVTFYTTAFDLEVSKQITSLKLTNATGNTIETPIKLSLLRFPGQPFLLEIGERPNFEANNDSTSLAHFGVNVEDVAVAVRRLVDAGAEQVRPITLVEAEGIKAKTAFFLGPDGETIELMELLAGEF